MSYLDDSLPREIRSLVGRCEVGETTFDNDDMSLALKFGESLWHRLCSIHERFDRLIHEGAYGHEQANAIARVNVDIKLALEGVRAKL